MSSVVLGEILPFDMKPVMRNEASDPGFSDIIEKIALATNTPLDSFVIAGEKEGMVYLKGQLNNPHIRIVCSSQTETHGGERLMQELHYKHKDASSTLQNRGLDYFAQSIIIYMDGMIECYNKPILSSPTLLEYFRGLSPKHRGDMTVLLLRKILIAADFARRNNIFINGIYPTGIFIDHHSESKKPWVYLADFSRMKPLYKGVMNVLEDDYPKSAAYYRSPEAFSKRVTGFSQDVWATGVTIHQLLFNKAPLQDLIDTQYTQHITPRLRVIMVNIRHEEGFLSKRYARYKSNQEFKKLVNMMDALLTMENHSREKKANALISM
ncbi:hypothetical protein BDF22DRAFT_683775 [Syncephalis plumigaleata]|nr:hypothetical protein BDF22DRAFT_683775 [Syncephalis plumigaleata]